VGELGQVDNHLNLKPVADKQLQGCPFAQIQCLYCFELFQRSNIQAHQDEQCLKRSFSCDYCGEFESTYEDITTNHWPVCHKYLVPCPNNCGETLQHQNVDSHTREECPLTIKDCDFKHVGCDLRLARKDMPEHLTKDLVCHVSLLTASHKKLEEENKQLKTQVVKLEQSLQELTTDSEPTCVDFVMNNFDQHKKDKDVWISPSFYSHPHGYKMCLAVYANGLDDGKGTHVSVYVYIRRGEYDNILRWPFQGTIPICVLGEHELAHLVHILICTTAAPLERVTEGDRSENGFGYPQFMPHSSLNSYLRNDSLHFRISQVTVTVANE
jgi:TNF receptor-associated factor 4